MPPRSAAAATELWTSARKSKSTTRSIPACSCAVPRCSMTSTVPARMGTVRSPTACAGWRATGVCAGWRSTHPGTTWIRRRRWLMPTRRAFCMLRDLAISRRVWGRLAAALIGLLLLAYLVRRAGPAQLWQGIASVGWGLVPVIVLAGLSQAVRTWAWRLTLLDARRRPSFGRMFGLRLASEAAGQVGIFGQVFGDTWRVAGLGADLPIATRIASVALDRALYTLSSTIVTIAGVVALAFVLPLPGKIGLYAKVFGLVLVAIVFLAVIAVRRRWPLISGPAKALEHIGRIGHWVESKREAIQSVEDSLLDFFHHSPGAFRKNLVLQMAGQVAAVLEVYLILRLMGHAVGFSSALAIEGLTKLVNVIGMINPGNAGTFEGGNMLFAKLVGVTGTAGLTLALIRRVRALFWTAVGAICAVMLPGSARREKRNVADNADRKEHGYTAVILSQFAPAYSILERVGELPVLLRAILGARKAGAGRIVVIVDHAAAPLVRDELRRTRRLPDNVEWCVPDAAEIAPVDRKSTRLNSSHLVISYAVFCLKKQKKFGRRRPRVRLRCTAPSLQRMPHCA